VADRGLNDALILRLAAEFQGFARDLHDLACDHLASWAAPTSAAVESVIRNRLREGRDLDRGNAHPGVVGKDFERFGFELWPALANRDSTLPPPDTTRRWNGSTLPATQ
jgi:hypothetical protein